MASQISASALFDSLNFDNRFVSALPADDVAENYRRQVPHACYSRVNPTPVAAPTLVAYAKEVAELIGMSDDGTSLLRSGFR